MAAPKSPNLPRIRRRVRAIRRELDTYEAQILAARAEVARAELRRLGVDMTPRPRQRHAAATPATEARR